MAYMIQDTPEKEQLISFLSNHKILEFDKEKDCVIFSCDGIISLLYKNYNKNIISKIYDNKIEDIPCAILHPSVFEFIVGKKSKAVTIHIMNDEDRKSIAKMLGLYEDLFMNNSFMLIKASKNGTYDPIDLIHEATHITQNEKLYSKLEDSYFKNINEIEAFINEIIIYQKIYNRNFNSYIRHKENNFKNKIPESMINYLSDIWSLVLGKNFWDIKIKDKTNWASMIIDAQN